MQWLMSFGTSHRTKTQVSTPWLGSIEIITIIDRYNNPSASAALRFDLHTLSMEYQ